jgi:putative CocE/NonD family hydrolase
MLITDSIIRARNRNSLSTWEIMTPGTIYEITVQLESTAYLFNTGHKIRLAISGSNFPRFEVNPNTGDALWQNSTYYTAHNRFYCNTTYPSHISLPLVDYASLSPFTFS